VLLVIIWLMSKDYPEWCAQLVLIFYRVSCECDDITTDPPGPPAVSKKRLGSIRIVEQWLCFEREQSGKPETFFLAVVNVTRRSSMSWREPCSLFRQYRHYHCSQHRSDSRIGPRNQTAFGRSCGHTLKFFLCRAYTWDNA
jgi:hypothetical protein